MGSIISRVKRFPTCWVGSLPSRSAKETGSLTRIELGLTRVYEEEEGVVVVDPVVDGAVKWVGIGTLAVNVDR